MAVVMIVIASILVLAGWVLSLAGISGTWVVLVATVGFDVIHDWSWDFIISTIIFALLCALVEVIEFVAGLLGAKAFGGSRSSQVGAFLGTLGGGLIGSFVIPIPIVGTIIGVVAGGFAGALIGEMRHQRELEHHGEGNGTKDGMKKGIKAGVGAMIARVFTIALKAALSTLMVVWFVVVVVMNMGD